MFDSRLETLKQCKQKNIVYINYLDNLRRTFYSFP